ncbi:putative UDP-glucose 6-dehydrogenase [Paenibacillus alvei DSM 29]|nr:putative UDP-glucose 6-dehydrogenase [Paenibacillus alvei DSM 29]
MNSIDILVIGLGYVGTTTALAFAESGWKITGFDTDHLKLCSLEKGELPFYEPGLEELLQNHAQQGNIRFVRDVKQAIENHQIFLFVWAHRLEKMEVLIYHIYNGQQNGLANICKNTKSLL